MNSNFNNYLQKLDTLKYIYEYSIYNILNQELLFYYKYTYYYFNIKVNLRLYLNILKVHLRLYIFDSKKNTIL